MPLNETALDLLGQLSKRYGDEKILVASDIRIPKRFTSGSLSLNAALGGGFPGNSWVEIYGKESHGKTFVTLKTIAANQELDPEFSTLWIAGEHFDVDQAQALGVDTDRVIVVPTQSMEFAYETVLTWLEKRAIDCVVIDSYPALVPGEESEKSMQENTMAVGAKLTAKFFRKVGEVAQPNLKSQARPYLGIFINQLIDQIGGFSPYGTPTVTPGGKRKNFAFYVRCEVKWDGFIKEKIPGKGEVVVGQTIKVKTVKNKSTSPQQVAVFDAYFRDTQTLGFKRGEYDTTAEIVSMGVLFDVIERKGAWLYFGGEQWQGKQALVDQLRYDLSLQQKISEQVLEASSKVGRVEDITEHDEA